MSDDITEDSRFGLGQPLRINNLPPVDPAEEPPAGYFPGPQFATQTETGALKDRVDALARLAATQQRINKRMLSIRTTTGVIAVLGWITAIVALAQR